MATRKKKSAATTVAEPTCNSRYLVLDFDRVFSEPGETDRKYRYQVYLLPAGGFFDGFGGSRSGLLVGKTPSMIVRTFEPHGMQRDVEYNLAAKGVWQFLIAEGLTHFSTLHNNGARRDADGMYEANG